MCPVLSCPTIPTVSAKRCRHEPASQLGAPLGIVLPSLPMPATDAPHINPKKPPPRAASLSTGIKTGLLFAILTLVAILVAVYDPRPSLRHVRIAILSGAQSGNYFATINKLAREVTKRKGQVENLTSAGSVENIRRLTQAKATCNLQFALVQGGIDLPADEGLELIGRLPRPESLIVLGRTADRIKTAEDLKGLRIGIGPIGSGTEPLARRVLAPLAGLDLKVSTQSIDQQLGMLERGDLDLGAMVIDDQAQLVSDAVRNRGLQILSMPNAASLARRLPFARLGEIGAGQYDYVRQLPPENKQLLQVETLIVGNDCASYGATQGLMAAITEVFPTFIRDNKDQPNLTGLGVAPAAKDFFDDGGRDLAGTYTPWLIDIMPTATWLKLIVGFSMLFSGMAVWHRFRLWRVDADRVKIERDLADMFDTRATAREIAGAAVTDRQRTTEARVRLDDAIDRLDALSDRCRRYSLSVLVPMGHEMAYRYQEALICDLVDALRSFKGRL